MKTKISKKYWKRITVNPEIFIAKTKTDQWQVINISRIVKGIYPTEEWAKNVAISLARKFFRVPHEYKIKQRMKVRSYEELQYSIMGKK